MRTQLDLTVSDLCQRASVSDLVSALSMRLRAGDSSLWNEAASSREYASLAGFDDPTPNFQNDLSHLIGLLKRQHRELGDLRKHTHEWNDDTYCRICGADGRA